MKLVWSPETASKAYIDTVKSCELFKESSVAELVSAMAAGWNARLVVETWSRGGAMATSIGLSVATHHTGGRHICVVPDEESRLEYADAMKKSGHPAPEVVVGPPEEAIKGVDGIDFLVVDRRPDDFAGILRVAKLGQRGAVLICKNAGAVADFGWRSALGVKPRIVRSVSLPVGKGLDIAHIGAPGGVGGGSVSGSGDGKGRSRWIKHIDRRTGEEHAIRR